MQPLAGGGIEWGPPQVAATLVAYDTRNAAGVLAGNMLNAVLVLLLVAAILGPILAERFVPGMLAGKERVQVPSR